MEATQTEVLVNITDKAAEKAKALLEARELTDGALRVFVAGGGCSGYQYGMALARSAEEDDIILMQSGVKIVIDPGIEYLLSFEGRTIENETQTLGQLLGDHPRPHVEFHIKKRPKGGAGQ